MATKPEKESKPHVPKRLFFKMSHVFDQEKKLIFPKNHDMDSLGLNIKLDNILYI